MSQFIEKTTSEPLARGRVRTLTLTSGNYGGILQAYALQSAILQLGALGFVESDIELPEQHRNVRREWIRRLAIGSRLPLLDTPERRTRAKEQELVPIRLARTSPFVRSSVLTVSPKASDLSGQVLPDFIAVGSDQVWRKAYADLRRMYCADVGSEAAPRLFSYAASFGVDNIDDYDAEDIALAREALSRFTGVSVREEAGQRICREVLAVEAEVHVDPTMLLTRSEWLEFVPPTQRTGSDRLVFYILDPSPITHRVRQVATKLFRGTPQVDLNPVFGATSAPTLGRRRAFYGSDLPTVEQWLSNMASAKFIVTDSFHGCVFAILFNKPFVCVSNPQRGSARFRTLLDMLGLESRMVDQEASHLTSIIETPIDWASVNSKLLGERKRSMRYLSAQLLLSP